MNKLTRLVKLALGLAITSTLLAPTLSPAQAATALTIADIYNPLKIVRADLNIPNDSITALRNSPKVYTPASITLSLDGKTSGNLNVDVRLKGTTSLQYDGGDIDGTPSF